MGQPNSKTGNSSKLLLHEEPLQVLPGLAVALGLNEAIILQQLHYWLRRKSHARDGREWHYNTYADWQKQFPFWSISTIKRTMVSLEQQGAITSANYNNSNIDKTKWYAINYDKLNELCESSTAQDEPSTAQDEPSTAQDEPSTAQIDPMDGSFWPHQDQETNTETTDRDLTPPTPLLEDVTAGIFNRQLQKQAKDVLGYLNAATGKAYPSPRNILVVLREKKGTVAQCQLVIDWWQQAWALTHTGQADLLNPDTPFKPDKFEIYLADARHWDKGGRQPTAGHQSRNGQRYVPQNSNDDLMAGMLEIEEKQRATE